MDDESVRGGGSGIRMPAPEPEEWQDIEMSDFPPPEEAAGTYEGGDSSPRTVAGRLDPAAPSSKMDGTMSKVDVYHTKITTCSLLGLRTLPEAWNKRVDLLQKVPEAWTSFQEWLGDVKVKGDELKSRGADAGYDARKAAMSELVTSYTVNVGMKIATASADNDEIEKAMREDRRFGPQGGSFAQCLVTPTIFMSNTQFVVDGWESGEGKFGDARAARDDKGPGTYGLPADLGITASGLWAGGSRPTAGAEAPLHLVRQIEMKRGDAEPVTKNFEVNFSELDPVNEAQAEWLMGVSKGVMEAETDDSAREKISEAIGTLSGESFDFSPAQRGKMEGVMMKIRKDSQKALAQLNAEVFSGV